MKLRRERLESGQGFSEYALVLALVSVASIFVLNALFGVLQDSFVTVLCEMRDLGRGETNCNFDGGQIVEEEVTIDPNAPVAVLNYVCNLNVCTFDPSASTDSNGSIVTYEFSWGDGTSLETVTAAQLAANSGVWTHTFPSGAPGTTADYFVAMRVTDDEVVPLTDTTAQLITISYSNQAPIVDFLTSAFSAGQYQFDPRRTSSGTDRNGGTSYSTAPATYDPDGPIAEYKWEIYNSANVNVATQTYTVSAPQIFNHTFNPAGTYRVELTVTDSQSPAQTTKVTRYVTVTASGINQAPNISNIGILDDDGNFCNSGACSCQKNTPPANATCTVLVDATDPEGGLNNTGVDIGITGAVDTFPQADADVAQITVGGTTYWQRTFTLDIGNNGNNTIDVTATDTASPTASSTGSQSVNIVMNNAPTFDDTPAITKTAESGLTLDFQAPATDLDGDTLTYTWQYDDDGDGNLNSTAPSTSSTATITWVSASPGDARLVEVIVSDGITTVSSGEVSFTLGNTDPVVSSLVISNSASSPSIEFTVTGSDAEDGTAIDYCWYFGTTDLDANEFSLSDASYTTSCASGEIKDVRFCSVGTYTVTVRAKDSTGALSLLNGNSTVSINIPSVITPATVGCGGSPPVVVNADLGVNCNQPNLDCVLSNNSTGFQTGTVEFFADGVSLGLNDTSITYNGTETDPVTFRMEFEDTGGTPGYFDEETASPQGMWIEGETSVNFVNSTKVWEITAEIFQQSTTSDGTAITSNSGVTVVITNVQEWKNLTTTNTSVDPTNITCTFTTTSTCEWTYARTVSNTSFITYEYQFTSLPTNYAVDPVEQALAPTRADT